MSSEDPSPKTPQAAPGPEAPELKLPPGADPNSPAFDMKIRTIDLSKEHKRERRQWRKQQARDLEAQRVAAEAEAKVIEVAPIATRARMQPRHWGIISSFVIFVILPLVLGYWYLNERAVEKYASVVAFTVQQEQSATTPDALGSVFAQVGGVKTTSDTDILYEFIQSQPLVRKVDEKFDLISLYSEHYDQDPIFSLPADATLEDLVQYWGRIMRVSHDEAAGLIELQVLSYTPELSRDIAQEILNQSQTLINDLNVQAREDRIRFALEDLTASEARLKDARAALILFRTRTQIVDPETDLAGRLGVVNTLQGQLAEALVEFDLLAQSTSDGDPRLVQAGRRIEVIRERLAQERANVASGQENAAGADYPTLLAEYEELVVAREIAEQIYRSALANYDVARADASRQSRYVAAFIPPTLPETAEFPQKFTLFGLLAMFIVLTWSIGALIYYSVRDSR